MLVLRCQFFEYLREILYKDVLVLDHLEGLDEEKTGNHIFFLRKRLWLTSLKVCDWSQHIFGASTTSLESFTRKLAMSPCSTLHGDHYVVVVVVVTFNRPFHPTSTVHPVSVLILHSREIQFMWWQAVRQRKTKITDESRSGTNQVLTYRVREHFKHANPEMRAAKNTHKTKGIPSWGGFQMTREPHVLLFGGYQVTAAQTKEHREKHTGMKMDKIRKVGSTTKHQENRVQGVHSNKGYRLWYKGWCQNMWLSSGYWDAASVAGGIWGDIFEPIRSTWHLPRYERENEQ